MRPDHAAGPASKRKNASISRSMITTRSLLVIEWWSSEQCTKFHGDSHTGHPHEIKSTRPTDPSSSQLSRDHEPCHEKGKKYRQEYIEENLGNISSAFCDPCKSKSCGDHGNHKEYCRPLQKLIRKLEAMFYYDRLYIGGGNSKAVSIPDIPPNVTIVSNLNGMVGGVALWRELERPE